MKVTCDHRVSLINATLKVLDDGKMRVHFGGDITDCVVDDLSLFFVEGYRDGDTIEVELDVECEGDFNKGTRDYFSDGRWMPGDPAWVDNVKVSAGQVDITRYISQHYIESITEELLEKGLGEL